MVCFGGLSSNENNRLGLGFWKESGQDGVFIGVFFVAIGVIFGFDGQAVWIFGNVGVDGNAWEKVDQVNTGALIGGRATDAEFGDGSSRLQDAVKFGDGCLTVDGINEAYGFDQGFHIAHGHGVLVARIVIDDDQAVFFGSHTKKGGTAIEELGFAEFSPAPDGNASDDASDDAQDQVFDDGWG